jgi:hypothetical protein
MVELLYLAGLIATAIGLWFDRPDRSWEWPGLRKFLFAACWPIAWCVYGNVTSPDPLIDCRRRSNQSPSRACVREGFDVISREAPAIPFARVVRKGDTPKRPRSRK